MLKTYEAIYEDGKLRWVREQPLGRSMRVMVTVLEEEPDALTVARRKEIWRQSKGCIKPGKSIEEIDADILRMRAEWEREWDA
ncbi:MAG: hypothetical protein V1792_03505 [Pseudomonadota bacterium]